MHAGRYLRDSLLHTSSFFEPVGCSISDVPRLYSYRAAISASTKEVFFSIRVDLEALQE